MHAKKLVKWGVALTSSLVLGGVGIPTGSQFVGEAVVYAEDQPVETVTYRIYYYIDDIPEDGVIRVPSYTSIAPYKEGTISKGETIIEKAPHIDGYVLADWSSAETVVTYDSFTGENVWHDTDWVPATGFFYKKVETPVETPVEKPAETPTDQPAEKPTEQPADQPTEQPVEQPADQPVEQPVEKPAEVPVEQPVEQPAEVPVEQPVEKPAETPTDKPVEQLTDASSLTDQTAGKVQAVTATDKKTVDKSAPSTPAVKTEEVSQPVAKTLPKTGDSSSMLLVLGGFLSGLSGLGLAATSRKRD
ncbi:TPA: LPXTG cell wall anchor domain-containing protein [Streptococcus suis]|uniref:LPXTG cell wall anchor domain-containing protein n=1 Tax=Streptococcus suis TaxID=1307 RepID=UPI00163A0543|nr:LPXTG cell wall anchor domain-containing protein [Streptococcus suis]HEL2732983.1 LPXTG cell wall anchor domain-containing protein [Streptococcus suis]HEM5059119.1 LPXTG cell wall anchor domain-containing protein [Streptococcus suis]HEM5061374.1 LPXTG cell wall anchor domain-containing protein [Streptococcus suis]HEM5063550.1 LPXTG cell wall anchor domain-containing protein [Streptococcus suis]HEM5082424.1 LPXTG cell wall anchor domain-containing protein [Streptococcus suis]